MSTIVRGSVPATEFALSYTLDVLPDIQIECERIVQSGESSVMPLMWIRYGDRESIDSALEADESVDEVSCLSEFEDEFLYRMEWIDQIDLLLRMLTNDEATVLDAYGKGDRWQIRVLYPNRDHFSRTHEFADEHGLTFDVESIREMEGEPAGRFGLTEGQYEALVLASKRGFFDIPRETTLEELADELGISHQALSERVRRGTDALVQDALIVGAVGEEDDDARFG
jgi:hypothetical protein